MATNTATYLERLLTFFKRAADVSYDPTDSGLTATTVQGAIDETVALAESGGFGSIAANTVIANGTTSSAAPVATAPQALWFVDATSGAGNIRGQVAPQGYGAVTSLATAGNVNVDITLTENGTYQFSVVLRARMATAGTRLTKAVAVCANRVSGTLTLEGTALPVAIGDGTGITLTVSATSGNLRVNVANSTGETISGRVHVGWFIEDLLS